MTDNPKQVLFNTGIQSNATFDYPYNFLKYDIGYPNGPAYLESESYNNYNSFVDRARIRFDNNGLKLSGGLWAGGGDPWGYSAVSPFGAVTPVHIIGEDGRIPDISSTTFANLDGSAITGLSANDTTKALKGGDDITGDFHFYSNATSTGNIIMDGNYYHFIRMNQQNASAAQYVLGEIDFNQSGTGKHRIITFGDSHATYPKEMQIGAAATSNGTNVRITGGANRNPDIFVSSFSSVGINTATPNATYKLDVNGMINASGVYKNGIEITGAVGDTKWTTSGDNIYNNNTGNVGIGTTNPTAKLHLSSGVFTNDGSGAGITTTGVLGFGRISADYTLSLPVGTYTAGTWYLLNGGGLPPGMAYIIGVASRLQSSDRMAYGSGLLSVVSICTVATNFTTIPLPNWERYVTVYIRQQATAGAPIPFPIEVSFDSNVTIGVSSFFLVYAHRIF